MLRHFNLDGKQAGWLNTGFRVRRGEWFAVRALGRIAFSHGAWARGPDGTDEHGRVEEPASRWNSALGAHPAGDKRKNSLVLKVGNSTLQASAGASLFVSPEDGEIHVTHNDNFVGDNGGSWNVLIANGPLKQNLLFVAQGPSVPANLKPVVEQFIGEVDRTTGGLVKIGWRCVHVPRPAEPAELKKMMYGQPNGPPKPGYMAFYSRKLHQDLLNQRVDATTFDGIFRVYDHPSPSIPTPGGGNTWTHYADPDMPEWAGVQPRPPGYTALVWNTIPAAPAWEYVLHEYLHMMDHRFGEVGLPAFANPDGRGKNALPVGNTNLDYYRNTLKLLEDRRNIPFAALHGVFGRVE